MQQLMKNPQMFLQKLKEFATQFQNSSKNPQQMVQQLLNEGKMSQEQFNQYRSIANQILGTQFQFYERWKLK